MATAVTVVTGRALPSAGEATSTFSVVVPAGTVKLVVGAVNIRYNPPRTITGITFNTTENFVGPSPVQANAATPPSFTRTEAWYLDNPTITTANIVVTWDGAARGNVVAVGLSDAQAGAFTATAGQATSAALAVASTSGGIVISCYGIDDGDGTTIALTAGTSQYNAIGSATAGGTSARFGVATQAGTGGSVSTTWTPTGTGAQPAHIVMAIGVAGGVATLTGTLTTRPAWRAEIQPGGLTVIATITGDTLVASLAAIQDTITAGLSAGNSTSLGWNETIRDVAGTFTWVRTSANGLTGTMNANAQAPAAGQTITFTIPAAALTLAAPIVATPTFTTKRGPVLSVSGGSTNGSGVLTFTVSTDDTDADNGEFTKPSATSGSAVSRSSFRGV